MKTTIDLTQRQTDQLKPFFEELDNLLLAGSSGCLIAQPIYPGALVVALITQEQGEAIQKILRMPEATIEYARRQMEYTRKQLQANRQLAPCDPALHSHRKDNA